MELQTLSEVEDRPAFHQRCKGRVRFRVVAPVNDAFAAQAGETLRR